MSVSSLILHIISPSSPQQSNMSRPLTPTESAKRKFEDDQPTKTSKRKANQGIALDEYDEN